MRRWALWILAVAALPALAGAAEQGAAAVNAQRMKNADAEPGQWMSYSRTWDEQRFSPLKQINDSNADKLGLAWYADLNTYRGVQATPLYVDGVLYNVSVWNVVTAYDAHDGKVLWTYDPKVETQWARLACCGPSARGIAAWNGKIYIGALDGRLIAVDARTGVEKWSTQTFDHTFAYSITGPPRVYDGKVIIGNGGADYGVRGFVDAYDAETGKRVWRFYTVPGNPSAPPDGEASDNVMAMAAKTWTGEWWKFGGGGTAWDSFAYDPKLRLVYIGTGNGSPHVQAIRSPGGGDNLFLCSILAVNVDTGKYAWHYQMVPNEQWDFTCTQPIVLADLKIEGRTRQVLMQAPKNGFFYVLDRKTGKVISAKSYVPNTWASGVDLKTGRPIVNPEMYLTEKPVLMTPTLLAAHTWHPMSYNPNTGLVYLSAQEQWMVMSRIKPENFKFVPFRSNSGFNYADNSQLKKDLQKVADSREKGYLLAWDPVHQREAFRVPYPYPGSGGILSTAGNILVQGTIKKTLAVYRADNGKQLWEMDTQTVAIAGPMTYELDGEQYIAVNFGWGGSPVYGLTAGPEPVRFGPGRLMVFKLGATGVSLPPMPPPSPIPPPPPLRAGEDVIQKGQKLFGETCSRCHGENARGGVKDLRFMSADAHAQFKAIVLDGIRKDKGMVGFADILKPEDAEAIHWYLIARANEDWKDETFAPPPVPEPPGD
jgi:quinohemoprotein ethanol dehydrogenase